MSRGHASLLFIAAAIGVLLVAAPVTSLATFEPPAGEVLRQDFSRADLLAAQWQPITGVWSATCGTCNSTTTGSSSLTTIFAYPNPAGGADLPAIPFDRYRLHARMLNPSAGGLVGVVYQYQNAANYYEAVFSPAGTASVRRVANGVTAAVASAQYAGGAQGVWFDVEVVWNDGRTTVRVNGIAVLNSIAQLEYTTAVVGLITHNTPAKFDNVSITIGVQPFHEDFNDGAAPGFTGRQGASMISRSPS